MSNAHDVPHQDNTTTGVESGSPGAYSTRTPSGSPDPYSAPGPYGAPAPYGSPGPYGPFAPVAVPPRPAGWAIAALILGLASLLLCWVLVFPILAGIVAVILGVVALRRGQSKGMSIAGIVTGGIGAIIGAITVILMVIGTVLGIGILKTFVYDLDAEHEITYVATVSEGAASYAYKEEGRYFSGEVVGADSAWTTTITVRGFFEAGLNVAAPEANAKATVTCEIYVDEVLVDSDTALSSVACDADANGGD